MKNTRNINFDWFVSKYMHIIKFFAFFILLNANNISLVITFELYRNELSNLLFNSFVQHLIITQYIAIFPRQI